MPDYEQQFRAWAVVIRELEADLARLESDDDALDGRLVMIAFLQGPKAEVNFAQVMVKRQTITGSTLRPRSIEQKGAIAAALREKVWPLFEAGKVKPVLFKTFPLAQAAEAHRLMESSAHTGKIVLTI